VLDSTVRQNQVDLRCRIDTVADDMRNFGLNVINDMEYMEQKLIEAFQRDTIAQISQEELEPIKNRLKNLEEGVRSLSPSRAQIEQQTETPSTSLK
jgi:archaellum component FlaC